MIGYLSAGLCSPSHKLSNIAGLLAWRGSVSRSYWRGGTGRGAPPQRQAAILLRSWDAEISPPEYESVRLPHHQTPFVANYTPPPPKSRNPGSLKPQTPSPPKFHPTPNLVACYIKISQISLDAHSEIGNTHADESIRISQSQREVTNRRRWI